MAIHMLGLSGRHLSESLTGYGCQGNDETRLLRATRSTDLHDEWKRNVKPVFPSLSLPLLHLVSTCPWRLRIATPVGGHAPRQFFRSLGRFGKGRTRVQQSSLHRAPLSIRLLSRPRNRQFVSTFSHVATGGCVPWLAAFSRGREQLECSQQQGLRSIVFEMDGSRGQFGQFGSLIIFPFFGILLWMVEKFEKFPKDCTRFNTVPCLFRNDIFRNDVFRSMCTISQKFIQTFLTILNLGKQTTIT